MSAARPRPLVIMSERLGKPGEQEQRIEASGATLRGAALWDANQIRVNAADATVIIIGGVEPFDRAALESLPACRAIVRRGVGFDNIDADAATELGIMVAIVPDASVEEVSDHALALLMAVERHIVRLDAAIRAGRWQRDPAGIEAVRSGARRFAEMRLGIVGFGRIGRALARKSGPLYGEIVAADPFPDAAASAGLGVEMVSIEELSQTSHHVSIHVPLSPATWHLVDAAFIDRMRPGGVIVNTSRGGLVDESALAAAINTGRLAGAGLDVTSREPLPQDDALLAIDRIVLTGHSAASSITAKRELARRAVDAVIAVLEQRRPAVLANPGVLTSNVLRNAVPGEGPR